MTADEMALEELLSNEPSIQDSGDWSKINKEMLADGLPGIITKMVIGGHDLYLKTEWFDGRIVRIDITISRGVDSCDGLPQSAKQVNLETTRFDLARSWMESECRMASNLLQTGMVGISTVLDEWAGVEGYPLGLCPQLPEGASGAPTFQKGPLHAASMLIKRNLVSWTSRMKELK